MSAVDDDLSVADLFCGAGGSITGMAQAGFRPVIGVNHSPRSIETVSTNHPEADFLCADINHLDGYECQVANLSAAHVYDEGELPAPQWRDRIFIVFTRKGITAPDLNLRPAAWCESCEQIVESEQRWKNPSRRRVGKYGQQYLYACPRCSSVVEPFVSPAIRAIDLSDIGERIGDRKRPLSEKTLARIDWGLRFLAWPVIAAGNTFERPGYRRAWPAEGSPLTARQATGVDAVCGPVIANHGHEDDRAFGAHESPLPTRATKISEGVTFMVTNYSGGVESRVYDPAERPLPTIVAQGRGHHQMVTLPFVTMLRANNRPTGVDEPLATVATGRHHYLTTPPGAFYVKNFGGNAQPRHLAKPLLDPLGSVTTHDHHALVIPYRKGSRPRRATDGPLGTVTTKTAEGVLHPAIDRDDCHYRTLKPREHLRAQDFDDSYVVTGNLGEQTAQAGNAVAVNCARWIGRRLAEVLS